MSVVVIKDTHGRGIAELAKRLRTKRVLVGVPRGPVEEDGITVAKVGAMLEFGAVSAPERPWLRPGARKSLPKVRNISRRLLPAVLEGQMSEDQALGIVGLQAEADVKREIQTGPAVPNAPSTISKKGSDVPRIDTRTLLNSVTHVVEKVGGA